MSKIKHPLYTIEDEPENFAILIALLLVGSLFIAVFFKWFDLPVVSYSNATGECVGVEPKSAGSCTDVAANKFKYKKQWVE